MSGLPSDAEVEQIIRDELSALELDEDEDHAENNDVSTEEKVDVGEGSSTLEKLESWVDLMQAASRPQDALDDSATTQAFVGYITREEEALVNLADIDRELEVAEAELQKRLSNLDESEAAAALVLSNLQVEAQQNGLISAEDAADIDLEKSTPMPAEMPSVESPEIVPKPGIFVRAVSPPKSAASGLTEEARTLQQPESQQPESLSLEDEHEYLLKRKREEAGEQSALQFRIDQLQARSTALTRAIRQHKQETREADEKAKVLTNWFANTGKVAFDKEKDRTAALMVRVRKLMEELEQEQNKLQAKIAAEEPNRLRLEVERNGYVESIRKLTGKEATLNEELVILQAELEKQENILEDKKALRDKRILEHMEELDAARKRDLELLLDSLRRQVGPSRESTTDHLQDLVMLDLTGNGLERIPNVTQAPKIRRVVLDHNDIADVKDLKPLKELKFLSLQDNKCSNLDIAWFTDLRVLDAAKNRLTEIQIGQNDEINRLRMLIYVDLSDNRLSNPSLSLSHSKLLQHLNLSNNCFMDFPEVPNDLLCELVISGNSIRALSLKQWSPALRVLEAASNNIQSCDPVAIAMCPFLREIDLSNNLITDFPSLYALAVCRDLEILTLDGTPIIRTMNFNRAVAALFPKLKMLNGKPISGIAREMGRTKIAAYPSGHAIKWCRLAVDYLYAFLMDEHRKEESIRSLGDWKAMEQAHERNIANSLGPRYRPYLRYLYSKQSESDTTTDAEVQEQRVDWLAALLQQNASEFDRMKKSREPSSDLALAGCIDDLEYQIKLHSIIVTQAMWRGRRERRRKLKKSGASRMLQKWWKLCLAQKEEAARKNQAAGAIQKVWKEYSRKKRSKPRSLYHPSPVDRVSRARTPVPATAPAPAQQPPPPKMTVEPSGISVEDTEDDDLENDAAIEEWLDDLDQARETFLGKDTEDYHFEEKPQPVPSVRRADSKEESFLKQQFAEMQKSPNFPNTIKPNSPIRNLLLSRGMVGTSSAGHGTFGKFQQSDPEDSQSDLSQSGLTSAMLVSRRLGNARDSDLAINAWMGTSDVARPRSHRSRESAHDEQGRGRSAHDEHGRGRSQLGHRQGDGHSVHGIREHGEDGRPVEEVYHPAQEEESGWNLTTELSKTLLGRKLARNSKMSRKSERREQLKDPMERLRTHQAVAKDSRLKDAAASRGYMRATTYEWDIKRGYQPHRETVRSIPHRLPPIYQPTVYQDVLRAQAAGSPTLLINNYVASKLMGGPTPRTPGVKISPMAFPSDPELEQFQNHTVPPQGQEPYTHRDLYYAFDHSSYVPTS